MFSPFPDEKEKGPCLRQIPRADLFSFIVESVLAKRFRILNFFRKFKMNKNILKILSILSKKERV